MKALRQLARCLTPTRTCGAACSSCRPLPPPLAAPCHRRSPTDSRPVPTCRLLSLEGSTPQPQQQQHTGTPGGKAHQQQQHTGLPGGKAQQHRDAKAEAKAAAAGAPRPKGPKGPCGTPTSPPAGGAVVPLPLASAMRKGCPPWNVQGGCDLQFVQLLPEGDAIRVSYPAGSGTPSSGKRGGCVLRGAPPCLPATDVLLRFDFRPRPGFEWTRGGKLGGGLHIGQGTAAGYVHSESAASARLVWGPNGACMLYLYPMTGVEQDAAYCTVARLGQGYGDSLFPGTFQASACLPACVRESEGLAGAPPGVLPGASA